MLDVIEVGDADSREKITARLNLRNFQPCHSRLSRLIYIDSTDLWLETHYCGQ